MDIFQDSDIYFNNFINCNDIILDNDYKNIKEFYYKNNKKLCSIYLSYSHYFSLFDKYYKFKENINIIYYIIILYYLDKTLLLNYIRFFNSKIIKYNLLSKEYIEPYKNLIKYSKIELINYLKKIIDYDDKLFYFLIYTMQYYL